MKVAVKRGNGLYFYECEEIPLEPCIVITEALETKLATLLKPDVNNDYTDFIETATEQELQDYISSQVPQTISQMKFRVQLILNGISIDSIYQTINSIPDELLRQMIYTKFEYAQEFERTDETLNQMAQMLQVSQEQLDSIFREEMVPGAKK